MSIFALIINAFHIGLILMVISKLKVIRKIFFKVKN